MQKLISFNRVLVVSGSAVFRQLMGFLFMVHAEETHLVSDREQAREYLTAAAPFDLAICDASLADDDGLGFLEEVMAMREPRPDVILVARQASEYDQREAIAKGARGYLGKPISFQDIVTALKHNRSSDDLRAPRRLHGGRAGVLAVAEEVEPIQDGDPQLRWRARDVSTTGAFFETESPFPVGCSVQLALDVGGITVHVKGRLVRVQEPSWRHVGGVGVSFSDDDPTVRAALDRFVSEGGTDLD